MTGTAESKERMIGIAFDGFENADTNMFNLQIMDLFFNESKRYQDSMYIH